MFLNDKLGDAVAKLIFNAFLLTAIFIAGSLLYFVREPWVLCLWCLAVMGGFMRHVIRYLLPYVRSDKPFKCSNCRHLKLPDELFRDEHEAFPGRKICRTCAATSEPVKVIIMWRDAEPGGFSDPYLPPGAVEALSAKLHKQKEY